MIDTTLFAADEDLKLLEWLRQQLKTRGYQTDEPKQKDGFWGCSILQQAVPLWLLVAVVSDEGPVYQWGISIDPNLSSLNPANWFKRSEGQKLSLHVMQAVLEACKSEPAISDVELGEQP